MRSRNLVCPYCYHDQQEHWDHYDYSNLRGTWRCEKCNTVFKVALAIEVTYVTDKV